MKRAAEKDATTVELHVLARAAAPVSAKGAHLDRLMIERIRATAEDDPTLDDAYRHLAACNACRARLADEDVARPLVEAARRRLAPRRGPFIGAAAATVLVLAGVATLFFRGADERVAITQRAFVGTMGGEAGTLDVPLRDLDVEVTVRSVRYPRGALIVVDASGHVLAPARRFERQPEDQLRAVVAPRTFAPHAGKARGLVVLGDEATIARALEAESHVEGSLDAVELALRDGGAYVARIEIESDQQ